MGILGENGGAAGPHQATHVSGGADAIAAALAAAAIPGHSYEKHTDITRKIRIPATAFFGAAGEAPVPAGNRPAVSFPDGAECKCYFSFLVPDDFVTFTSLKGIWIANVGAGNMDWKLDVYYAAAGENLNLHSDLPGYGVTAIGGVNILNVQEPANPVTLVNLAVGDDVGVSFGRLGGDASDTLGVTAKALGLLFEYVARQ